MKQHRENELRNELVIKIGNWISPRLNNYEAIIILFLLIGFVLRVFSLLQSSVLIAVPIMTLATLYTFDTFSISIDENAGGIEQFIYKLCSISSSVGIIGILFLLERWPGNDVFIMTGCLTLIILIPIILVIKSKKGNLIIFSQRLLLRIFLIGAIGLILNFTATEKLIKYKLIKEIEVVNKK